MRKHAETFFSKFTGFKIEICGALFERYLHKNEACENESFQRCLSYDRKLENFLVCSVRLEVQFFQRISELRGPYFSGSEPKPRFACGVLLRENDSLAEKGDRRFTSCFGGAVGALKGRRRIQNYVKHLRWKIVDV